MSKQELELQTKAYFEKYAVQDLVNQETVILFILESPHTQEVKYGYPVAGSSGLEMARFIYGREIDIPLGKLIKQQAEYQAQYKNLPQLGLLNVSPAPMQRAAIEDDLSSEQEQVLEILEKLRVNYKTQKHRKQEWNIVKNILINNFAQRLLLILKNYTNIDYLVPCGRLAARYLELISEREKSLVQKQIIDDIPHPAFNQWSRSNSMFALEEILTI